MISSTQHTGYILYRVGTRWRLTSNCKDFFSLLSRLSLKRQSLISSVKTVYNKIFIDQKIEMNDYIQSGFCTYAVCEVYKTHVI